MTSDLINIKKPKLSININKIGINTDTIWNSLFFIFTMSYYTFVRSRVYMGAFKILFLAALGFFGLYCVSCLRYINAKRRSVVFKSVLFFAFFIAVVLYEYRLRSDSRILMAMLAMICAMKIPLDLLFKELFWTKLICLCAVFGTGGYEHINIMSIHIGMTIMLFFCTKKSNETLSTKNFIILLLLYIVFWKYTDSGAFKICMGLFIGCEVIYKYYNPFKKFLCSKLILWIYPILMFAIYYFSISMKSDGFPYIGKYLPYKLNAKYVEFIYFMDKYMSHRLSLSRFSLEYFGVSWLGGNVQFDSFRIGDHYFNLDSGMMWLLQGQGVLMTILIMTLSVFLMKYLIDNRMYRLIIVAVVAACWSVNEDMLISIGMNFIYILMGRALFMTLKHKREENEYTENNPLLLVWRKSTSS